MSLSDNYPDIRPLWMNDYANAGVIDPRCSFARSDSTPSNVHYWSDEDHLSSENLLTYSNPNNAAWNESNGAAVTTNAAAAPDGTTTASSIIEDSANSQHRTFASINATSGQVYTLVAYLKGNGRTIAQVVTSGAVSSNVEFDLSSSGTATTRSGSPANSSISQIGSTGWYKCSFQVTAGSTATLYLNVYLCDSANSNSYTGDGSSGVYAWGLNLATTGQLVHEDTSGQIHREYAATLKSVASSGQPRFEYEPTGDREARGLLIESSSSNLVTRSEEFNSWTTGNASIQSNAAVAPDGTLSADTLTEAAETSPTTNSHYVYSANITPAASTSYTFSVYLKAAGRNNALLYTNIGGVSVNSIFNLSNGTVTYTGGSVTNAISPAGNGYYRCSITWTTNSTAAGNVRVYTCSDDTTFDYTGNGYGSVICWGAQVEASKFSSSYISTNSSASSRTQDSLNVATADIGYTGGPVSVVAEFDIDEAAPVGSGVVRRFAVAQLGGTEFGLYQATYGGAALLGIAGGSLVTGSSLTAGANKAAMSYDTNDVAICANGGSVTTDTSQELVDASGLNFYVGGETGGASALNGHIKRVALYSEALTDTELQSLTS